MRKWFQYCNSKGDAFFLELFLACDWLFIRCDSLLIYHTIRHYNVYICWISNRFTSLKFTQSTIRRRKVRQKGIGKNKRNHTAYTRKEMQEKYNCLESVTIYLKLIVTKITEKKVSDTHKNLVWLQRKCIFEILKLNLHPIQYWYSLMPFSLQIQRHIA